MCELPDNPIYIRCSDEDYGSSQIKRRDVAPEYMKNPGLVAMTEHLTKKFMKDYDMSVDDVDITRDEMGIHLQPGHRFQVQICFSRNVY